MQPTSFVASYSTVAALAAAIICPFFGSLGDFTPHRRSLMVWSTYACKQRAAEFPSLSVFLSTLPLFNAL